MTSSIEIREDSFKKHWNDLFPLFVEHFLELGLAGTDGSFSLDVEMLSYLEEQGRLVCVGVFDGEDILAYSCIILNEHPMFKGRLAGSTIAFYVDPKHRTSMHGLRLIKKCTQILKDKYYVMWFDLVENVNYPLGKFPERMGFVKSDIVHRKQL